MKIEYTAKQLDDLSIFALRDLARECGHNSPTNKRKSELIEYILGLKGESIVKAEESATKKRRGRPPKKSTTQALADEQVLEQVNVAEMNTTTQNKEEIDEQKEDKKGAKTSYFEKNSNNFNSRFNVNNKFNKANLDTEKEENKEKTGENIEAVEIREGVLEICPDGYGFLRANNYEQGDGDAYIAAPKIRKSGLRKGDYVKAYVKKLAENRPMSVQEIISVNGDTPDKAFTRPVFESLIPIYPEERYKLELATSKKDFAIRAIDLVAPIGKGQRAMIVSPPKAGKTTLLKKIANSISSNYPNAHLMVLLVDERPEEVTDMQRSIKGEVIYSTFDEMPDHHTKASEMVLERAKRLVELGQDVVILMDSLTRLARAYNLVITPTGKTLSGGIDPGSLYLPKKFFGAARNIENGGSLTIIATALVDTGSRMDDVIYEEFKGTGNMEIHLDRKLSEKRIFPAIDLARSGTRREELLLSEEELLGIFAVRKMLSTGDVQESTEKLISMMMGTDTNKEFIQMLTIQMKELQKKGYNFV
ncbi:MAG: transcription termination factor Rho [Clostridia bacterium]|nr:transcription termination factor Rho [Clostridia bacterium]